MSVEIVVGITGILTANIPSAVHQAYLPIIAGAERASTLHYCCNDKAFAWGPVGRHDHKNDRALTSNGENAHETEHGPKEFVPQVLLIDAGCEWNCYASDSEYDRVVVL